MAIDDIYNFIKVSPLVGTSGQPTADQFRDVRDESYEVVVNLAPDGLPTSLPDEAALLEALGIEYHHLPVPWNKPSLDRLAAFEQLMVSLEERRVLVHCQANFRVTAFYACYATDRLGWSRERADALIDRIWTSRPGFEMDDNWKGFLADARRRPPL